MTLPNWAIRTIIAVTFVPVMIWAAFEGAARMIAEAWEHFADCWRHPEYTRWGRKRT